VSAATVAHAPAGLAETKLVRAKTIDQACELLAEAESAGKNAALLAGGTDWVVDRHLMSADEATKVDLVVDVTGVGELRSIRWYTRAGEPRVALGGGVTYWMLRSDKRLAKEIPMLGAMARDVGAVQIQTRGTLAGNIATASPAADGVPVLMALDGEVKLRSVHGERTVLLNQFFAGYRKTVLEKSEVIVEIELRVPRATARATWRKVGTRSAQSIAKVALASVVEIDRGTVTRARFGMASVAAVTHALPHVRTLLEGKKLSEIGRDVLDAALGSDVTPIDDVRSTGAYRMHVAKALLWRAVSDS
jgi:CO/xanthine dehydrogenase FAD-binding subunit